MSIEIFNVQGKVAAVVKILQTAAGQSASLGRRKISHLSSGQN